MSEQVTQVIPYTFDPPSSDYEEAHLEYESTLGGQNVTWPLVGVKFFLPEHEFFPKLDSIEAHNSGRVKVHGLGGFSIGTYHEFLINIAYEEMQPKFCAFKMGAFDVTFGDATPLAALIFSGVFDRKYFGEWDGITSLRIFGASEDEIEAAFICATMAYKARFNWLPTLNPLVWDEILADENDEAAIIDDGQIISPPIIVNVEPLRFFYRGLAQSDDAAACIYFYRVLEHFSFLTNEKNMKNLRHDPSLSDADFSKKILDLITKEEKNIIFRLVSSIVDNQLLAVAVDGGLTSKPDTSAFCDALYAFRNSIVHGKYSYGYVLHSSSVLDIDVKLSRWRSTLQELARRALDHYGSKKS